MLVVLVGLLYEKLGQQHNNLLATYRIFIVLMLHYAALFMSVMLWGVQARMCTHVRTFGHAQKLCNRPVHRSSPVQSSPAIVCRQTR